jgi:hypothetical protein
MFAVNKPTAHRPNVKEQDSRDKNTFLVISFFFRFSRWITYQRINTDIILSDREPQIINHY